VFDVKTTLVTVKGISVGIDVSPSDIVCEFQTVTLTAFGAATYLWSTAETTQTIEVFGSNVYSVTGFSDGCSDTAQVAIVVNPLAHLSLVASPSSTIIEGQVATLTVGGANSYVWSTGDTTASVTVSDAGTYAVIGFLNNCSDMANITVTVLPLPPQLPSETNAVLQNLIFLFLILYGLLVLLILFYIEESF
jgi:hypothetical protein